MIIACNNCDKKFDIDSSLIPLKGRLLQCSSCNHKWFFKKGVISKSIKTVKIGKPTKKVIETKEKINSVESIDLLDTPKKQDFVTYKKNVPNLDIKASKNKRNYNIHKLTIIFIISFIALIIILDTFQSPISKVFPNIELMLYNLYETIYDIISFLKDLI